MPETFNVYCDESCHLEHDRQQAMVLGAVWCPASHRAALGRKVKAVRKQYGLPSSFEIKWTKVSPGLVDFYLALIDLFFDEPMLHFRSVIVPDKEALEHGAFGQTHDEFYYKMWYLLLTHLVDDEHRFRVFIDIKDTLGGTKVDKLHEVLCNKHYDFDREVISDMQLVHSHELPLLQLADLLIGALSHLHRGLNGSAAKKAVIKRIQLRSGYDLSHSTPPRVDKFNFLIWRPQTVL